jgi:catechol O-methyltransferase
MAFGARRFLKEWQVGDGREAALERFVLANAREGSIDAAIEAIDRFAYRKAFLVNVGDEKGAILEDAIARTGPRLILELGTYCGYSALRCIRGAPGSARVVTLELNPANAAIARRILAHAGIASRVEVIVGALGDGGTTVEALRARYGVDVGGLDFVFIDHAKDAYLSDLEILLRERWLREGAVVFADNLKTPGAPDYLRFMRENEGKLFRTREHATHLEYQRIFRDVMLESKFVGGDGGGWPSLVPATG